MLTALQMLHIVKKATAGRQQIRVTTILEFINTCNNPEERSAPWDEARGQNVDILRTYSMHRVYTGIMNVPLCKRVIYFYILYLVSLPNIL
jgi:hypothetical protein